MSEVSDVAIKRTQDTLGKIIKKPVLSDKLLRKPPFKFLHDVIHAVSNFCIFHPRKLYQTSFVYIKSQLKVITTTGFLDGLYTAEELQPENIKDREAKITFLQKTIDALSTIFY